MHRDKKIGFALGILLVGIVAAFFFRNEPDPFAELPPLADPAALDAQIAQKPIAPYTEDPNAPAAEAPVASAPKSPWEISDIFRPENSPTIESAGLPISAGAPAPIDLAAPIPIPENQAKTAIEVGNPFGEAVPASKKPVNNAPLPGNENWTAGPAAKSAPLAQQPAASLSNNILPVGEPPASQTSIYKIVPGDTLSVLAEKHLGSSRRYMEIYEANRDKLRNPNDIRVGMMIRIPPRVKFTGGNPNSTARTLETRMPQTQASEFPTLENTTPFEQEQTTSRPSKPEGSLFTPFSRSPLAPIPH